MTEREMRRLAGGPLAVAGRSDDVVATSDQEDFAIDDFDAQDELLGLGSYALPPSSLELLETQEDLFPAPPALYASHSRRLPSVSDTDIEMQDPPPELLHMPSLADVLASTEALEASSPASTVPLSPTASRSPSTARSPAASSQKHQLSPRRPPQEARQHSSPEAQPAAAQGQLSPALTRASPPAAHHFNVASGSPQPWPQAELPSVLPSPASLNFEPPVENVDRQDMLQPDADDVDIGAPASPASTDPLSHPAYDRFEPPSPSQRAVEPRSPSQQAQQRRSPSVAIASTPPRAPSPEATQGAQAIADPAPDSSQESALQPDRDVPPISPRPASPIKPRHASPSQANSRSSSGSLTPPPELSRAASPDPVEANRNQADLDQAAIEEALREEQNARYNRALRTRNPSQLNPYQIEAQRYAAALLRNDWEDALVGQRSVRVQEMRRLADENKDARKAGRSNEDGTLEADDETQDWLVDDMGSSDDSAYTEVSDGHGGRKRQIRSVEGSSDPQEKENMSPRKQKEKQERREARLKRKQERLAAARLREPAVINHPGIKRARPIAPPVRNRSPPLRPTEDLSHLIPQSDDDMDFGAPGPSGPRKSMPAFARRRRGSDDSDSSAGFTLAGMKRRKRNPTRAGSDSGSETSDNDVGATAGIQPAGLFDDFSADVARVHAMRRQRSSTTDRNRGEQEDSDSDSEYRRLFKDLRKMMPFHMARKYIEDVKNMRKGKAYHSDGHVSSTPEPSSADEADRSKTSARRRQSTPATSPPPEPSEVRPGEAKKRMGPRDDADATSARYALVGDSQSSSSDSDEAPPSIISVSSTSEEERRERERESDTDQSDRDNSWWTRPASGPSRSRKPKDTIDQLLSRAGGKKKKKAKRRRNAGGIHTVGATRQSRLESVGIRRMPAGFGKTSHREGNKTSRRDDGKSSSKRKHWRQSRLEPEQDQRVTVDLLDDDTLFEFDMPAQRDDEFAFLSRGGEPDSIPGQAGTVQSGLGAAAQPMQPGSSLNSRAPSSIHSYMHRPIGPLTPASTAGPSLASYEGESRRQAPQQPVHMIPPLRQSTVQSSASPGSAAAPAGPATPAPPAIPQQMDAETWATYRRLRIDFGIQPLPFGLHFSATSYLGRGRLAKVLQAAEPTSSRNGAASDSVLSQHLFAFAMQLRLDASITEILADLPSLFDAMFVAILPDSDDTTGSSLGLRTSAEESLAFLGRYLSNVPRDTDPEQFAALYEALKAQLGRMTDRLQAMAKLGSEAHAKAALSTLWFSVEYAWRALLRRGTSMDAAFQPHDHAFELSVAAQHLMLHLCKHGLHRTFRTIRAAALAKNADHVLSDMTAELWVCLIHLLHRVTVVVPEAERICSFWPVFEAANKTLVDRGVGRQRLGASERTWYSVFAICALSQFGPASGMTGERPAVNQYWPLITYALSLVRFRFDEKTEKAMSLTSVQRRDGYIRVVLQRCLTLSLKWGWNLDRAEVTMSRLFDIFNSHKLCNLPSEIERTHDFPAFLCKYDESFLKEVTPEDLGDAHSSGRPLVFHVFVKLLARAAYDLRTNSHDDTEAQRKISRLFSRMSPVRTMPFTKASPPTSIERSILFNHYTMVLLYLLFVPGAANQRLRQIRSFLPFPGADIASQMTCIRAMLYIGVLFRHHDLPLQPVTLWFSEALPMLVQQHEALERQRLSGSKTGPYKDWTATAIYRELRSTSTLLIAALRAIQHILKHSSLDNSSANKPVSFPDLQLLQADWIKTVLEGQVAIDPAIGREAMNTIQEFLKQRNQVIAASQSSKSRPNTGASGPGPEEEESQDSFAGMFDDVDMLMDDPMLASMLGEVASGGGAADETRGQPTLNAKDAEFAELIKNTISPALFRLLSNVYHPDRAKAGKRISLSFDTRLSLATLGRPLREQRMLLEQQRSRQRYVELIVDCWAGCADVLVRNGLRDWDKYFSAFGDESWKRIVDPIGRRDVGLRFLNTALHRDPAAYEMYEAEFVSMWFQAAVSRLLSIQDKYTQTLLDLDSDGPFFRRMPWTKDAESGRVLKIRDTDFMRHRLTALLQGFDNLSAEFARLPPPGSKTNRKPMIFASVSAMVAAMRQNIEDTPAQHPDRKDYLRFCLKVVTGMKERLGPGIMRGAGAEVTALETHLVSLGATLLSSAEEAAAAKAKAVDATMEKREESSKTSGGAGPNGSVGEEMQNAAGMEREPEEGKPSGQPEPIVVD